MDHELGACLFHKRRRELGEYSADGGDQAVVGQQVQVREGGASERRVKSRSTPSEAKPGSLWTCGSVPSPAATPRVCHQPPDCTRGISTPFSTSRYTLVLTFTPTSKMWGGMMWPSLETTPKTIIVAGNFVFITLGTSLFFVAIQRWFCLS